MAAERRPPPDLQGTLLARRYRIVRTIERGGMGAVYEALDEMLGRSVAVKILLPELSREERYVERFRREAIATAALAHPNVVHVTDFQAEPGRPAFLVMEMLQGRTLARALMEDGPFSVDRAVGVATQVCAALEAAHAAGIVHRDLKPGNVFVVPLGDGRELVKVLDFGIAQIKLSDTYVKLTSTGALLGTPAYMPPEQARGTKVDGRADVYALGGILYTCLTARKPFSAPDPASLLKAILTERPAPLLSFRPDVGPRIAGVIDAAMEKDPANRFGSARALRDALSAALMGTSGERPVPRSFAPPPAAPRSNPPPPARTPYPPPPARTPYPPPPATTPYPPPPATTPYPPPLAPAQMSRSHYPAPPSAPPPRAATKSATRVVMIAASVLAVGFFVAVIAAGGIWLAMHERHAAPPGQLVLTVASAPGRDTAATEAVLSRHAQELQSCLADAELPLGRPVRWELWQWQNGRFASVTRLSETAEAPGPLDACGVGLQDGGWPGPAVGPDSPVVISAQFR